MKQESEFKVDECVVVLLYGVVGRLELGEGPPPKPRSILYRGHYEK